ncbi:MAG: protein kinase [candidate division Zixibacteria bacterium]|nr:protein kinase [candidate division Zixibacteria bacterium]
MRFGPSLMDEPKSIGKYKIVRTLGGGGMAKVYLATDPNGARVALKVPHSHYANDPEFRRRLRSEKDALCQLNHPCIAVFKDFHDDWDPPVLAMEFVEGQTLDDLLDDHDGPLPTPRACQILIQIAEALAYCHKAGIIHRDIKPANILLTGADHVKVTDFGIARLKDVPSLTHAGTVVGSGHIMAPEQWRGEKLTAQVDIYALGTIAYRLLTGRYPFEGGIPELSHAHCNEHAPAPRTLNPDLAPPLSDLILACLNKKPKRRLSSADEFISRIAKLRPLLDVYERYRFEDEIGRGSMGVVFRARRRGDGMKVAIKTLDQRLTDDTLLTRLQSEAAILARLNHRFICKLIETRESFLVMEYVEGEPLSDILHKSNGLPVTEAVTYFRDILEAVGAAHRENIIHRDLKPSNVIITDDPIARHAIVMDFGIAKLVGSSGMTRTSEGIGAIPYKAPELWHRQTPGPRSDVYALGAMLYEMLTSQYAFPGIEIEDFREQHLNHPPKELPPRILVENPELGMFIAKCLAKDPEDRYASVDEMYVALSNAVATMPITAPQLPKAEPVDDVDDASKTVFLTPTTSPINRTTASYADSKPKAKSKGLMLAAAAIPVLAVILWFTVFSGSDSSTPTTEAEPLASSPSEPTEEMAAGMTRGELAVTDTLESATSAANNEGSADSVPVVATPDTEIVASTDATPSEAIVDEPEESAAPAYSLVELRPTPDQNTRCIISGHDYGANRDVRLNPGTYRLRVVNPEYPIFEQSFRLSEQDTVIAINLTDHFARRRRVELRLALSPRSSDVALDLALNGNSRQFTSFPVTNLSVLSGKWMFETSLRNRSGGGNVVVDSCVSFPYGGGPRVVISGRQREIDFGGRDWEGKRLIPIQIYWSKR